MLVSMNWIRDFVDLGGLDIRALIRRFTLSAAEVEEVFEKGGDVRGVVAGRIESVEPHPASRKLHLLRVFTGDGTRSCVCGAPNVRPGMTVPFAPDGSLVGGKKIETAQVAGYVSEGMCCSEYELGISADHSGLMELPDGCAPGTDIKEILDIDDVVFEVDNKSLTNRPDLWGHYGIAREFAAMTGRALKAPRTLSPDGYSSLPRVDIEILDSEHCLRYCGAKAENITVKVSPANMRIRLFYCGLRAINLLADLTNYVMLELGQPMHAFDNRKVDSIKVRRFEKEFAFATLDGTERRIGPDTLMICCGDTPVAVAGIMGGLDSEITGETDSLLLESANFDAVSVRKSSARLGLRTDSSMRYEKSLDPELCPAALGRLLLLLTAIDPGARIVSSFTDCYVRKYPPVTIKFTRGYVDRYTGMKIDTERILATLRSLGFEAGFSDGGFTVGVPSWRATKDISIAADIVEEITRIYGYDNFTPLTTRSLLRPVARSAAKDDEIDIKRLLSEKYLLHEVHSYVWCDGKKFKRLGIEVEDNIRILNIPLPENGTLRNSMIPSLLCFAFDNRNFAPSFGMFEAGRVFCGTLPDGSADEQKRLGILLFDRNGNEKQMFFRMLAIVSDCVEELRHTPVSFERAEPSHSWQHPANTASVFAGGKALGTVAALSPANADAIEKNSAAVFAELDLSALASLPRLHTVFREPSKFPGIDVDLSFVCPRGFTFEKLARSWETVKSEYLGGVRLTDVYEGAVRSVTVRLSYSCPDRTLTREQVQPHINALIEYLAREGINLKS